MPTSDPAAELEATIARVARDFAGDQTIRPSFEASPKPEMGDYSSNAAMLMAKSLGRPPREIAAELAKKIEAELEGQVEKVEVAGPGFINLFLGDGWYRHCLLYTSQSPRDRTRHRMPSSA